MYFKSSWIIPIITGCILLAGCAESGTDNPAGDSDAENGLSDGDVADDDSIDGDATEGDITDGYLEDGDFDPSNLQPPDGRSPELPSPSFLSSIPAHLDALPQPPPKVSVTFIAPVDNQPELAVFMNKKRLETSDLATNNMHTVISVVLPHEASIGIYDVLYRVTVDDKEEAGSFTFFVERREYEGDKLDSLLKFRENSIKGPQYTPMEGYRLVIDGLVSNPLDLSLEEVMERDAENRVNTLNCVEGWSATVLWTGPRILDLIAEADPDLSATTVILYAYDDYSTSMSLEYLEEFDPLLTHTMNGVPLPAMRGFPFQLASVGKWGYKWIRWITRIELSDDDDYRGFWESYGYNNDGSLDGPIRETDITGRQPLMNSHPTCGD